MIENAPLIFPSYSAFECLSGELLWGHTQTLLMGASNFANPQQRDSKAGPTDQGFGGTIKQCTFKYCVAARCGQN